MAEVVIEKKGCSIIITPKRKTWLSLSEIDNADDNYLIEREDIIEDNRVKVRME